VRVYTVPGKREQARYALDVASSCLDYYNNWFGLAMPLPKTDLVALPDFSSGQILIYS
jgi:aminopeptidase N